MNEISSIYFQACSLSHLKNSYQKYSLKNSTTQTQHTDFNDISTEQLYNNKNNPYPKKAIKSYDNEPWKNILNSKI